MGKTRFLSVQDPRRPLVEGEDIFLPFLQRIHPNALFEFKKIDDCVCGKVPGFDGSCSRAASRMFCSVRPSEKELAYFIKYGFLPLAVDE